MPRAKSRRRVPCPQCGQRFNPQGMGAHRRAAHPEQAPPLHGSRNSYLSRIPAGLPSDREREWLEEGIRIGLRIARQQRAA